jgi:uncharacterized membrane protein (DUF441 family)
VISNVIVLAVAFPIWREFELNRYPRGYWIRVYVSAGVLIALVVVLLTCIVHRFARHKSLFRKVGLQGGLTYLTICVLAVLAGFSNPYPAAYGPDWLQHIQYFFAEFQFFRFFPSGVFIAVVSATLYWLVARGLKTKPLPAIRH